MSNIFLFFCFIIIIFDPWFNGVFRGVLVGGTGIWMYLLLSNKKIRIGKDSYLIFIKLLLFAVISILPSIYNQTFDPGVYFMYIKLILYYIVFVGLFLSILEQKILIEFLKRTIYIQLFIVLLCSINFTILKDFIFSVHTVPSHYYNSEQAYRLYFFTSVSFFQLSLFFGFLFNFSYALYKEDRINIIIIGFIFLCGIFSGRSFILFAIITVIFYGANYKTIILSILSILSIIYIAVNYADNPYIHHALEPIINYMNTGEIETSSSDKLVNQMLYLPSLKQIIFGDGIYYNDDGSYYGGTDSGFMRQILYGGVFYLLSCLYMMYFLLKKASENWFVNKNRFIISSYILFFIANIKADTFMYPSITLFFLIILTFPFRQEPQ